MDMLEEHLTMASVISLINTGSFYSHEIIKVKSGVPLEDRGFVQSIPHLGYPGYSPGSSLVAGLPSTMKPKE